MNHRNYQKELDTILEDFEKQGKVPRLLLHSCCAPCSSYVLEYLSKYFEITLYYYNPNIYPLQEYMKRVKEQEKLISEMKLAHPAASNVLIYGSGKPPRSHLPAAMIISRRRLPSAP